MIDEERAFVLTKYTKRGKVVSDHNIMIGKFNLTFSRRKANPRIEMFDFKNKESQAAFLEETSATNNLSASFTAERSFLHNSNIFLHNLNYTFHTCFKKIRITKGVKNKYGEPSLQELLKLKSDQKLSIISCKENEVKDRLLENLNETEKMLTDKFAAKTAEMVKEQVNQMTIGEGKFSHTGFWKIKKKFSPRPLDPPMAKKDENGHF